MSDVGKEGRRQTQSDQPWRYSLRRQASASAQLTIFMASRSSDFVDSLTMAPVTGQQAGNFPGEAT